MILSLATAQSCTKRDAVAGPTKIIQSASSASGAASSAVGTPVSQALKMDSFKCDIKLITPPTQLKTTDPAVKYRVSVTNSSNELWKRQSVGSDPFFKVNIGYHWIEEKSHKSVMEGGRAWFSRDLPPGASEELDISISPPKEAGAYILRIEPVEEAVAWFSANNGCKQEVGVTVVP